MFETIKVRHCRFSTFVIGGTALCAATAALITFGAATAGADEIGVDRTVNGQGGAITRSATQGEVRGSSGDSVHSNGEVRDSMKAVPDQLRGHSARGWNGSWRHGMMGGL